MSTTDPLAQLAPTPDMTAAVELWMSPLRHIRVKDVRLAAEAHDVAPAKVLQRIAELAGRRGPFRGLPCPRPNVVSSARRLMAAAN